MGLRLRWIFLSDSLPRDKWIGEIIWILSMAYAACMACYLLTVFQLGFGLPAVEAQGWSALFVALAGCITFRVFGFGLLRAALIATGLALVAHAGGPKPPDTWPLQVLSGFWLALRVFSAGPNVKPIPF